MEQEVLFYGEISNFSVSSFIGRMNEAKKARMNVHILANSSGGDADAGFGMIKAIRDFPFNKKMIIHGSAYSMMAYASLFVEEVSAIEQSLFLFHRASSFFEEEPGVRELLVKRNETLKQAMEEKLDMEAFTRISGVTLDQLFDMNSFVDVTFTADQAQEIGLVNEVIALSANETQEINNMMMAASSGRGINPIKTNTIMNVDELKAKHPDLYNQIVAIGKKEADSAPVVAEPKASTERETANDLMLAGIAKERERVAAWQVYAEVDAKKVAEGIASGKELTLAEAHEFMLASSKKNFASALSKGTDTSGGSELSEEQKNEDPELSEELNVMAASVTEKLTSKYKTK